MIKPHPAEAIMSHPPLTVEVFIHRVTVVINILHIYVLAVAGKKNKKQITCSDSHHGGVVSMSCLLFFFSS